MINQKTGYYEELYKDRLLTYYWSTTYEEKLVVNFFGYSKGGCCI